MARLHVAILKPAYVKAILRGEKTVESRMTTTRQPPFGQIAAGERLFLKASGGPFMATAIAGDVEQHEGLDREATRLLYRRYHASVGGDAAYWQSKADSRFAVFVTLRDVEPMDVGPAYRVANMRAWYALDESESPVVDLMLTKGAIRNRWVAIPRRYRRFPEGPATVLMPDGVVLESQINPRRHLGGRGWRRYHEAYAVRPGDAVRVVAVGERRYRVSFVKRATPS